MVLFSLFLPDRCLIEERLAFEYFQFLSPIFITGRAGFFLQKNFIS